MKRTAIIFEKFIAYRMLLLFGVLFIFSFTACKKEQLNTSSGISFSTDTLSFDTLFSTLGSSTRFITIKYTHKQAIKISNIQLAGGITSPYRINVDGDAGTSFNDIEIPAKDSIYVFVEVTINPTAANLPFIVEDSVQFQTNGILQQVQLNAYGQNAHFFNGDSIENNTVWNDDLPYVILNYLQIKSGASLSIQAGCDVYFGSNAALLVEGDLNVNGTDTSNMVTFRGVRLDKDIADRSYDDFPGQYAGVFFLRNSNGNIEYLNMRNSLYGINVGNIKTSDDPDENLAALQAMSISNAPTLTIKNSKIYNHAFYGLFGFLGKIYAENTLIYNCGKNVVGLFDGGDYQFLNCTFYNRSSAYISHAKEPLLYMNDYFKIGDNTYVIADAATAIFENCIMSGTLEEEIIKDDITQNPLPISLSFDHCVVKTKEPLNAPTFLNCKNENPVFKDIFKNDFHLKSTSPCVGFSTSNFPIIDIDGFARANTPTDCGAYIFQ
ncbi:MAG TPA: hypothetical protein PK355_02550 [Chitinophagales bacterium]|nr:hypothetical protein [Chitinophagales bacterium]